jgi:uncharacterized lipoprotein
MAYLREEKENLEVSYPLNTVWEAIPKAIAKIEWTIQETNEETHTVKIKTKGAFLSYPSKLIVKLSKVDEKTTKMSITGETPVTTITSVADYGRTRERIEVLVATLSKLMGSKPV